MASEQGDLLPKAVREFLAAHVLALDDLAVLAVLLDSCSRWWDVKTMAAAAGLSIFEARRALDGFTRQNLLDIRVGDDVRYRLNPGTEELECAVHALAAEYRRAPARITGWIAHWKRRGVSDFADAFRIKPR